MARTHETSRQGPAQPRLGQRRGKTGVESVEPQLLDVVALTEPLPEHGLAPGAEGTVVDVLAMPRLAYLVEFTNDEGETVAELVLRREQLSVVWRAARG